MDFIDGTQSEIQTLSKIGRFGDFGQCNVYFTHASAPPHRNSRGLRLHLRITPLQATLNMAR
jgi:hypothetical protein